MSLDVVGFFVAQVDDSIGDGSLALVEDIAVNGAELGTVALALSVDGSSRENQYNEDKRYRRRNPSGFQLGPPSYNSSGKSGAALTPSILDDLNGTKRCSGKRATRPVRSRLPLREFPRHPHPTRRRPHRDSRQRHRPRRLPK